MTNTLRNLEREWKAGYTITVRGDTSLETSCIDVEKQIPGEFLTSCKRIGECIQELRKKNCKLKAENDDYMNRYKKYYSSLIFIWIDIFHLFAPGKYMYFHLFFFYEKIL